MKNLKGNGDKILLSERGIATVHNFMTKTKDEIIDVTIKLTPIEENSESSIGEIIGEIYDSMLDKITNHERKVYETIKKCVEDKNNSKNYQLQIDDIIVLDNTICKVERYFMVDNDVSSDENERRMLTLDYGTEEYKKYHKWGLSENILPKGESKSFGIQLFDSLEELQKKVLELGGSVYNIKDKYNINKMV